jgi:hypothetical protein
MKIFASVIFTFFILWSFNVKAQNEIGFNFGLNNSRAQYYDGGEYEINYNSKGTWNYQVGIIHILKINKEIYLYSELNYIIRNKNLQKSLGKEEINSTFQFISLPVLLQYVYDRTYYRIFIKAGPELNYWLGGNVNYNLFDISRSSYTDIEKQISFKDESPDLLKIENPNNVQFGLRLSGGFTIVMDPISSIQFQLNLGTTHTQMSKSNNSGMFSPDLSDNYRNGFFNYGFNVGYLFNLHEFQKKYHRR